MSCLLCGENSEDQYCEECVEQLKTKIGMKCIVCGTIGFIDRSENNIRRLEFFMEDFRKKLETFQFCIIPMNGCPECQMDDMGICGRGFTA